MEKNDYPKVSVILPVYNVAPYLEDCLESIFQQKYPNIEIVAINDGSTDDSESILQKYGANYDFFRLLNQQNKGLSVTRNRGLRKANGKYIYFLDSDDLIAKGAISFLVELMEENDTDIITFVAEKFKLNFENRKIPPLYERPNIRQPLSGQELFQILIKKKNYSSSVPLYFFRRNFLESNNLQFKENIIHEDEAFTPKALILADKAISLSTTLYYRRIRKNSITTTEQSYKHIQGYIYSVSELLDLKKSNRFSEETKHYLHLYATNLFQNAMSYLVEYNKKYNKNLNIFDFSYSECIKALGIKNRSYARYPMLYQYLVGIKISIKKLLFLNADHIANSEN